MSDDRAVNDARRETDDDEETAPLSTAGELELDDVDVRDLLRSALAAPRAEERRLTLRIQGRIREQSRGRFYADGWSQARTSRTTFLVTTVLMLGILVFAWFALAPRTLEPARP
ncbi:MAG: hypothetical protein AAF928_14735, partial [Myxococcota bacterium]